MVKKMKMAMAMFVLLCGFAHPHKEYQYEKDIQQHQSRFACKMSGQRYTCEFNPQKGQAMLPEEWISDDEVILKAKYTKSSSKKSKGMGVWGQFLMGLVMITCAFPCIWMNERRQVRTYKLINAAQESAKVVENVDEINDDLNEALVLAVGDIISSDDLADDKFTSIVKSETLCLRRSVEVFQVTETQDDNGETQVTKEWTTQLGGDDKIGGDSFYNESATLGAYAVSKCSLQMISNYHSLNLDDYSDVAGEAQNIFEGQYAFISGKDVIVRKNHGDENQDEDGDVKVSWQYVPAGDKYTIFAQQMKTDKDTTSFRQWNPERLDVPWGEDNGSSTESSDFCLSSPCCLISSCVSKFFKAVFQEVIHEVRKGKHNVDEIISDLHASNAGTSKMFRCLGWLFLVIGNYLLFVPLIALLKWIPLIGWLLGALVQFVVIIWAFLFGSLVFMITLAVAWIFFRPLFGIALLAGAALIFILMFVLDGRKKEEAGKPAAAKK